MDPITLAAITGGFAAVKSAVSGVRSALESADDVGAIAGHLDRLFATHSAAKKRVREARKNKNLKNNKFAKILKLRIGGDDSDETSLANVAAAKLAEKQHDEEIRKLSIEINRRFGAGTWDEILDEQKKLIEKKKEIIKKAKEKKQEQELQRSLGRKALWEKVLIESGKFIAVGLFVVCMILVIIYLKESGTRGLY